VLQRSALLQVESKNAMPQPSAKAVSAHVSQLEATLASSAASLSALYQQFSTKSLDIASPSLATSSPQVFKPRTPLSELESNMFMFLDQDLVRKSLEQRPLPLKAANKSKQYGEVHSILKHVRRSTLWSESAGSGFFDRFE
jgi:hypothetical protein